MQTLIINGQEKETKYSNGWLDSYGKQWIYEDMETNHLMNVYKHIEKNFKAYIKLHIGFYPKTATSGYLDEATNYVEKIRKEIKLELLTRGLEDSEIENHIEETWKMGPNPYRVEMY